MLTCIVLSSGRSDPAVVAIEAEHTVKNFFLLLTKIWLLETQA